MKSTGNKTRPLRKKVGLMMLPREYLSWTGYSTFVRSREEYIRHYFYGEPKELDTPALRFGKYFAELLEKRVSHHDPVIDMLLRSIPSMSGREYELEAILPTERGNVRLLGTLDQFESSSLSFDEFKTGTRKWTQRMAVNHGQMKFYALMLYLKTHRIASSRLIWIETERTGGRVEPTGHFSIFPVQYTLPELLEFGRKLAVAAQEISDLYYEHIKQLA